MLKSSLLEILRTFDREEFLKFEDFLKSPYHNKNNNVIKLFSVIKKYSPEFNNEELAKEIVWKKLFPEKDYNYGTMKNHIHELSKLAMKFIVLEEFENNILEKENILVNSLHERNIMKLFSVKFSELERRYSGDSFQKEYFFVNDFYSSMSKMIWIKIYHQRANSIDVQSGKELIDASAMFIYGFLIYLFKYFNNVLTDSLNKNFSLDKNLVSVFLKEISHDTIDKLLNIVKENSGRDYRILKVFWDMSKSQLNKDNIEYYLEFKKSLYENISILSLWDAKDLFSLMGNCLNNLNPSQIDIDKELFDISDTQLRSNIIFNRDGTITNWDFNLYILRAFNAGNYEAIEKFTGKYINKVPKDNIEYCKKISKAYLLFGLKKYDEALGIISNAEHPNFIIKIRMKHFKIKCLYELKEFDIFENEYKSIYHFLKNNKSLSLKAKADTKNLFEFIHRMFRLKEKFNAFEFDKLKNEIKELSINKNSWLNEKINEIGLGKIAP